MDRLPGFDPTLYRNPAQFEVTLEQPGVTGIGNGVDLETFNLIEQLARDRGRTIGKMMLARNDTDSEGRPVLDYFPVYTETILSVVGDYIFEAGYEIGLDHVEEAEGLIFTSPEFEHLSEEQKRRNIIRLAHAAGDSSSSKHPKEAFVPLIGGCMAQITTSFHEGALVRTYTLLEMDV